MTNSRLNLNLESQLERAITIACKAHEGQTDKSGKPYILHPLRLMLQFDDIEAQIVAVLHDTVEDSDVSLDDLKREGLSATIVEAIECLTKRDGEKYMDFIRRLSQNPLARKVKMADLKDNMNILRLKSIQDKDLDRLKKYHEALNFLLLSESI